jgi:MFS family permease
MLFFNNRPQIARNYDSLNNGIGSAVNYPQIDKENIHKPILEQHQIIRNFIAVFSSIFLSSLGFGLLVVMISLTAEKKIVNEFLISIASITQIFAGVVLARFLPKITEFFSSLKIIFIASFVSAVGSVLAIFYFSYFYWLVITFILGSSFFIAGVVRQTIMIEIAPVKVRAMTVACGTMVVAIGNALGPLIFNILHYKENYWFLHLMVAVLYLLAILPLLKLRYNEPKIAGEKKIGLWPYVAKSPKIMFSGFVSSYCLSSVNAFVIIYGIKIGLAEADAAMLYSIFLFGTIFSIPVGFLTDLVNKRVMILFSLICAWFVSFFLLVNQFSASNSLSFVSLKIMLFLLFGSLAGVKLPAIVLINEKYQPTERLAVNSAFARFGLIGNITGLVISGILMYAMGKSGLWVSIFMALSLFLTLFLTNIFIKKRQKLSPFSCSFDNE